METFIESLKKEFPYLQNMFFQLTQIGGPRLKNRMRSIIWEVIVPEMQSELGRRWMTIEVTEDQKNWGFPAIGKLVRHQGGGLVRKMWLQQRKDVGTSFVWPSYVGHWNIFLGLRMILLLGFLISFNLGLLLPRILTDLRKGLNGIKIHCHILSNCVTYKYCLVGKNLLRSMEGS